MIETPRILIAVPALIVGLASAPALHAQGAGTSQGSHDSMVSPGMMGGGGMTNMMGGTSQMQEMMDHCSQMMSGSSNRPNEQWRNNAPAAPGEQE